MNELASVLAIPLKADAYQQQSVGHFWITLELHSSQALKDFQIASKAYGVQIREQNPHLVRAAFEARNVNLTEDFSVRYAFDPLGNSAVRGKLDVIAHRDSASEPGFFQASGLLAAAPADSAPARTIIALFDNSLSMQWEKLERSFQALDSLLHALRPTDRFNVLMFNSEVETFQPAPMAASPQMVERALDWVRQRRLRGGTNLEAALKAGVSQARGTDTELVLLTDRWRDPRNHRHRKTFRLVR